jgi:hypothetical protein
MNPTDIGLLNERPLHAALKEWYQQPDDRLEVPVDGYVIDIMRGDLLIEIQTGSYSPMKKKLIDLTARHPVRLVCPITAEKWIVKRPRREKGAVKRRKSPRRGNILDVFTELVSFPELLCHENFSLDVLLIQEEEIRRDRGRRGWRRKQWMTEERRLLGVLERLLLQRPADACALMTKNLPAEFTTADLAFGLNRPLWMAQKMAYCLRKMNVISQTGWRGRSVLYAQLDSSSSRSLSVDDRSQP